MMPIRLLQRLGGLLIVFVVSLTAVRAATIEMTFSQPIAAHWGQAGTSPNFYWSDGAAPSAGNAYIVGSSTGKTLRTPETASSTFAGDTLTLVPTGQLLLKNSSVSIDRVYTANNLILDGGTITHGSDNNALTLAGAINVVSNSTIGLFGANPRPLTIASTISGSADLTVSIGFDDQLNLSSTANPYSGAWLVNFGGTGSGAAPQFNALGVGSLGSGNISIGTTVQFNVDYDINNPFSSLMLDGEMTLDQNHTFGEVTIAGTPLAPGFYDYATLSSTYPANFAAGGSGSITVIPEPALTALLLSSLFGGSVYAGQLLRRKVIGDKDALN